MQHDPRVYVTRSAAGDVVAFRTVSRPGPRVSRLAVWSFALGFLFFIPPIGIVALFLGLAAREHIRASNGRLLGADAANAGIWFGAISALALCGLMVYASILTPSRDYQAPPSCRSHLKQLGLAIGMYQADYAEALPPNMQILCDEGYLKAGDCILTCPNRKLNIPVDSSHIDRTCDYYYFPVSSPNKTSSALPIAWDKYMAHSPTSTNALFTDLHVQAVDMAVLRSTITANAAAYVHPPWLSVPLLPEPERARTWPYLMLLPIAIALLVLYCITKRLLIRRSARLRAARLMAQFT